MSNDFLVWLAQQPAWWRAPFAAGRIKTRLGCAAEAETNDEIIGHQKAARQIEAGEA